MRSDSYDPDPEGSGFRREVPMRSGRLVLEPGGFRFSAWGSAQPPLRAYSDICHLATGSRGIWVATRQGASLLRRSRFENEGDPERLAQWLVDAISRSPGSSEQLARIASVDRLARQPFGRPVTSFVALLCAVLMGFQIFEPFISDVGAFAPSLVGQGEWWRLWTANFLHSTLLFPMHVISNLIMILLFAFMVERPLGALPTVFILAASGLGAMGCAALQGYVEVIGASGLAAGLVGAVLCLELDYGEYLPAWWRLPRRLFLIVLLFQALLDFQLPFVAGAAHIGGFAAGFAATYAVAGPALRRQPQAQWVKLASAAAVGSIVFSFLAPIPLLQRDADAMAQHGRALLRVSDMPPGRYNDLAWRMATEIQPDPEQLYVALALAERAVDETDRSNPDVLDTLAEVQFLSGDRMGAIFTIDEALAIDAGEKYFWEQRRRFTGERAPGDRPAPPDLPWFLRNPENQLFLEPGVEV